MKTKFKHAFLLTFALSTCLLGLEQSKSTYNLRFVGAAKALEGIHFDSKGETFELRAPQWESTPRIAYQGSRTVTLYEKRPSDEGIQDIPVAEIDLPGNTTDVLVVLLFGPKNAIRSLVYDDSLEAFPINHIRVVNLSGLEMAGEFNETRMLLEPGQFEIAPVNTGNSLLRYRLLIRRDGQWIRAFASRLRIRSPLRMTFFCFPLHDEDGEAMITTEFLQDTDFMQFSTTTVQ